MKKLKPTKKKSQSIKKLSKIDIHNFIKNILDIDNEMIEPSTLTLKQKLNLKRLKRG